ncbi:MAG: hypothetical protein LBB79_07960 [Prevotellaceae bacterium]|jgi:hypothetical protein|nr:hypothetical protein [Prevotellaceae bacterium]
MNNSFTEALLAKIMGNRYVPKSQVERQLSPIIDIFLESAIQKLADENIIWSGKYRLLAAEFPFHNQHPLGEGNRSREALSVNIDFLAMDISSKTIILIELKTDCKSMKGEQLSLYDAILRSDCPDKGKRLSEFLDILKDKNPKYVQHVNSINEIENDCHCKLSDLNDIRLLYIAPKKLMIPQSENVKHISFSDLYNHNDISHPFKEDWKIVTEIMQELDDIQDYAESKSSNPSNSTINQSQSRIVPPDATYKPLKELVSKFETGTLNSGYVGFKGGRSTLSFELINKRKHIIHNRLYKWKEIRASNDKQSNWIPIKEFMNILRENGIRNTNDL